MNRNYSYNGYKNNHSGSLCKITELRIVHEPYDVDEAINEVFKKCKHYPVVGVDCEWNPTTRKNQQPDVALLQIATVDGFCVLIRTCFMAELPTSVLDFLSDRKIIKVGVGIFNDGKVLHHKFQNCQVVGKLDIRFLSRSCNVFSRSESLKELSKSLLNVELDKDNVLKFRWDLRILDDDTATYAALDALAGVKIFEKLLPLYHEQMSEEPLLPPKKLIEKYFIDIDDRRSLGARILDRKFNFEEPNEGWNSVVFGEYPTFGEGEHSKFTEFPKIDPMARYAMRDSIKLVVYHKYCELKRYVEEYTPIKKPSQRGL